MALCCVLGLCVCFFVGGVGGSYGVMGAALFFMEFCRMPVAATSAV